MSEHKNVMNPPCSKYALKQTSLTSFNFSNRGKKIVPGLQYNGTIRNENVLMGLDAK